MTFSPVFLLVLSSILLLGRGVESDSTTTSCCACHCEELEDELYSLDSTCLAYCDCRNHVGCIIKCARPVYDQNVTLCRRASDVSSARRQECAELSGICPDIFTRSEWMVGPDDFPNSLLPLSLPVCHVRILDTDTDSCIGLDECKPIVQGIQDDDQNKGKADISFNFLVDVNGSIYEGRSWHYEGQHSGSMWDPISIGIAVIGTYNSTLEVLPSTAAIAAVQNLVACGVVLGNVGWRDNVTWTF